MTILDYGVNILVSPFTIIWEWLLMNILTPFLLLAFLILFFVGQFYLIKLYFYVGKVFILNLIKLFNLVMKSKYIKKILDFNN